MTLEQKMEFLIENGIATEEEIKLVTCINGWNEESFDDIYYVRCGEHFVDDIYYVRCGEHFED